MTSNAEIAKAMAENMTHAAVPLYGKKLRLPDRGAIIGIIKGFGGCCSRHISVTRS